MMDLKLTKSEKTVDMLDQSSDGQALVTIQTDRYLKGSVLDDRRDMITVTNCPDAMMMIMLEDKGSDIRDECQARVLLDPDEALVLAKVLIAVARGKY